MQMSCCVEIDTPYIMVIILERKTMESFKPLQMNRKLRIVRKYEILSVTELILINLFHVIGSLGFNVLKLIRYIELKLYFLFDTIYHNIFPFFFGGR